VISEIDRTCDRVAIIREGRLVRVGTLDALRDLSHHDVTLRFGSPVPAASFEAIEGVSEVAADGAVLRMRVVGPVGPVIREAGRFDLVDVESTEPSLEETFLAAYGREAVDVRGR
jgi:ABC-2 type transport system ATP-binding protein